ncbi:MAG: hypothetical protein WC027_02425 [Candidatus Paceibacterota bacterium]
MKIIEIARPNNDQKNNNCGTTDVSQDIRFKITNIEKTEDKETKTLPGKFFAFRYTKTPTNIQITAVGMCV